MSKKPNFIDQWFIDLVEKFDGFGLLLYVLILDVINKVCNKNSLNLKNIDITEIANGKIIAKAYFPYHSNKLLFDYFILEIKKEEGVLDAHLVLNKDTPNNFEGPHES